MFVALGRASMSREGGREGSLCVVPLCLTMFSLLVLSMLLLDEEVRKEGRKEGRKALSLSLSISLFPSTHASRTYCTVTVTVAVWRGGRERGERWQPARARARGRHLFSKSICPMHLNLKMRCTQYAHGG